MSSEESETFTKKMRNVTKEIHNISDALINAKLGIAMGENQIWAEGLLVFYEIFKYLEEYLDRVNASLIGMLDVPGMRRTPGFEQDLEYYLGKDWKKSYKPRQSVLDYLSHLRKLEAEDPYLLIPYVYHLYMGLLSGGQILRKKKQFIQKFSFTKSDQNLGMAVTEIKEGSVHSIKKEIARSMNEIAEKLDDETKEQILEESKMVFVLNNNMVNSIEGTGTIVVIKFIKYTMMSVLIAGAAILIKRMLTTPK